MKNLLDEKPTRDLHGGSLLSRECVERADLEGREVLDVGCGFGWFVLVALDAGAARVVGVEPDEADLATARGSFAADRTTFARGSAIDLPFEDARFDTVVCWEVLEHIPKDHERQAFAEFRRVLKPGGVFYMSTPYAAGAVKFTDPAWWLIGHRHYRKRVLASFAHDAGLEVERLEARGDWWQVVAINNLYIAKWIFRRGPFYQAAVNQRLDAGYRRERGYAAAFMKCRRPG